MLNAPQVRHADLRAALRVLLVEDNATDAMVAEAAVARAAEGPFTVLRAQSVGRGLELIASEEVQLVLLDLNLPDSKGLDTLRRVRPATRCPIIIVTSEDAPGMDERALQEGAFEILHKGQVGVDAIARLLRLAERESRTQAQLDDALGRAGGAGKRRYTSVMNALRQPQFRSTAKAREYLESVYWPQGVLCPVCNAAEDHQWIDAIGSQDGRWKCRACGEEFSVAQGTLFEDSRIPLHVWLQAVYLLCSTEGRIGLQQLPRVLGVTHRTAWLMTARIREVLEAHSELPDLA